MNCEFCDNIPDISKYEKILNDGTLKIAVYKDICWGLTINGSEGLNINFCPICGRDLRE